MMRLVYMKEEPQKEILWEAAGKKETQTDGKDDRGIERDGGIVEVGIEERKKECGNDNGKSEGDNADAGADTEDKIKENGNDNGQADGDKAKAGVDK